MSDSLRNLFHQNKLQREESNSIKVLVSLKASPDDSCLAGLREIGLSVTSVEGNKLTGEIDSNQVSKLEAHAHVSEVERSVKLSPTASGKGKSESADDSDDERVHGKRSSRPTGM